MKKIRLIFTILLLLAFVPCTKGQEMQQVTVEDHNGNILYSTNLTSSDTITFSKFSVPHGSSGVLINGVLWATCNVDAPGTFATSPSASGMFYQFNRRMGWSSTDPMINHEGGTTWDSSLSEGGNWETAKNPCPTGWRVPTLAEQQSLLNYSSFWGELNGVSGRFFGNGDQRVFFPAAGYRSNSEGTLYGVGDEGYYWSATSYSNCAHYMEFFNGYAGIYYYFYRSYGLSVRCVSE